MVTEPWDQPALDDMPEPIRRVRRAKRADDKVRYHRYVVADPSLCERCIEQIKAGERTFPWRASHQRMESGVKRLLCFLHTQEAKAADEASDQT